MWFVLVFENDYDQYDNDVKPDAENVRHEHHYDWDEKTQPEPTIEGDTYYEGDNECH